MFLKTEIHILFLCTSEDETKSGEGEAGEEDAREDDEKGAPEEPAPRNDVALFLTAILRRRHPRR